MNLKGMLFKYRYAIKIFVAFSLFCLLFYKLDFNKFLSVLSEFNYMYLIPMSGTAILVRVTTAYGLKAFLSVLSFKVGCYALFTAVNYSRLVGALLPGRSGDFSIIFFLRKSGVTLGAALAASLLDKLITLLLLTAFAVYGVFTLFPDFMLVLLLFIAGLGFSLLIYLRFREWIHGKVIRLLLGRHAGHFSGFSRSLKLLLRSGKATATNVALTGIKWGATYLLIWSLFLHFGGNIGYLDVVRISGIISIIQLVPVSISGLGVTQISAVIMYDRFLGVPEEITAAVMLLWLVFQYATDLFFCCFPPKEYRKAVSPDERFVSASSD
jgi:uncharacterized protein (TIRG00374 family)